MNIHHLKNHADHFHRLARVIAEANDLPVDDEAVIDTAMGETDLFDMIKRAVEQIEENEAWAGIVGDKINDLSARKKRLLDGAEIMRSAVAEILLDIGSKSFKTPEYTLSARLTKPKLEYVTPEAIPEQYWREKVIKEIDKEQIKAVYEVGGDVPGVIKTNGRPSLTVRTA